MPHPGLRRRATGIDQLQFHQSSLRRYRIQRRQRAGVGVLRLFGLAGRQQRIAADFQAGGIIGLLEQLQRLVVLARLDQESGKPQIHQRAQGVVGGQRTQRGDRGIALAGLDLRLGQLKAGNVGIKLVFLDQRVDRALSLLQVALRKTFDGRLVALVCLLFLAGLVLLPPLPAENHG